MSFTGCHGLLGFSGAIASQSSSPVNIDSVETYMKKDSFEKNVGSRFVTNRSIDSFGVSDTVDIGCCSALNFYLFSNY
mgnify:CR=1 FL=1